MSRKEYVSQYKFKNWVRKMNAKFISIGLHSHTAFNKTFVYHQYDNKFGYSMCQDGDIFDTAIGIAVATARYLGEPILVCKDRTARYADSLSYYTPFYLYADSDTEYQVIGKDPYTDRIVIASVDGIDSITKRTIVYIN